MRLFPVSATKTLPAESVATPFGEENWPSPVPALPHLSRKVPHDGSVVVVVVVVVDVVVLVVVVLVVVVVGVTQVPSAVGFFAWKNVANLLVIRLVVPNCTL